MQKWDTYTTKFNPKRLTNKIPTNIYDYSFISLTCFGNLNFYVFQAKYNVYRVYAQMEHIPKKVKFESFMSLIQTL